MSTASQTARLGKEAIGYVLGAPTSSTTKDAPSHAAIVSLANPNASSPLASLRGTTPVPSGSSFDVVTTTDGASSLVVHADRVRALIHVHVYHAFASFAGGAASSSSSHTCPLSARLHPPEPTPALALSPCGSMLAAGAQSGRLYLWHLGSGRLLASVDAHFRAITCLAWSACQGALVTGSEDSRILVWSLEALLSDSASSSASHVHRTLTTTNAEDDVDAPLASSAQAGSGAARPYAILSDHVQGISALTLSSSARSSVSSFPSSMRIMSASFDGSVKLWDVRTRSLIATWSFNGPVKHLAVDVGFRSFFAVVSGRPSDNSETDDEDVHEYDWIRKVDLFSSSSSSATSSSAASMFHAAANNGFSTSVYQAAAGVRITALAMSLAGSHLLLGTSNAQMVTLDVQSSVAIRTSSLLAAGQAGGGAAGGKQSGSLVEVVSLSTFLVEDASSLLLGSSVQGKTAAAAGRYGRESAFAVADKLQRTQTLPTEREAKFPVRLTKRKIDVMLARITPPSLTESAPTAERPSLPTVKVQSAKKSEEDDVQEARRRVAQLERDNEKLNELLKRAQKTNAGLWERVVKDAVDTP